MTIQQQFMQSDFFKTLCLLASCVESVQYMYMQSVCMCMYVRLVFHVYGLTTQQHIIACQHMIAYNSIQLQCNVILCIFTSSSLQYTRKQKERLLFYFSQRLEAVKLCILKSSGFGFPSRLRCVRVCVRVCCETRGRKREKGRGQPPNCVWGYI